MRLEVYMTSSLYRRMKKDKAFAKKYFDKKQAAKDKIDADKYRIWLCEQFFKDCRKTRK